MRNLERLHVLRDARSVNPFVYELVGQLPDIERYGLAQQLRRATVSIAANIAEGLGRGRPGEFAQYLRIASGSAAEVEVLLMVAVDLDYFAESEITPTKRRIHSVRWQLKRLIDRVTRGSDD